MTASNFSSAIRRYIKANPWLDDRHLPIVVSLQAMAKVLDAEGVTAPLVSQFNLALRNLQKLAPSAAPEVNPVDDLISRARSGDAAS